MIWRFYCLWVIKLQNVFFLLLTDNDFPDFDKIKTL